RIISLVKKTFDLSSGIFSSLRVLPNAIDLPKDRPHLYPTSEKKIGTVGLLIGCIGDVFTAGVNDATIRVLNRLGYDVKVIPKINCCGALAAHAGYLDHTRELGREVLSQIERSHVDYFITNIAGCGAMMKEYPTVIGAETTPTVSKIKDISEFLYQHHLEDLKALALKLAEKTTVAYHAPCHLYHGQKIIDLPAKLLEVIENAEVTLLEENDICCGSAGTYNIERPQMGEALLERKIDIIKASDTAIVMTANAGCLMQLKSGTDRGKMKQQVYHFIEIIDLALAK
ncbi:MAG TPA: (Fe-S)-binding protein, partial [Candidatus Kapabacteria bacterium]|nr:(Fe-S)-binding protein [Candidatus Kapabacteria bacterium]